MLRLFVLNSLRFGVTVFILFFGLSVVQAKTFDVVSPRADLVREAILEASSKTKVRAALLYGLLARETGFGRDLGRTEKEWSSFCTGNNSSSCENWRKYDCKGDYKNAEHFKEILKIVGYENVPTSSTCALGFIQFEPKTWWSVSMSKFGKILDPWNIKESVLMAAYHLEGLGADEGEVAGSGRVIGSRDFVALQRYYCGSRYKKLECVNYARKVEQFASVAEEKLLTLDFQEQLERLRRKRNIFERELSIEEVSVRECPTISTDEFGFGSAPDPARAKETGELLERSTKDLQEKYRLIKEGGQKNLVGELQDISQKRKQYLVKAMYLVPDKAVFNVILAEERLGMANFAKACLESEATVEGMLEVLQVDFEDGTSQTQYSVVTEDGKQIIVHPAFGLSLGLESGMRVRVKGIKVDDEILFNGTKSLRGVTDFSGGIIEIEP